jgi:DNA-binding CsgD family transcriptional regulator
MPESDIYRRAWMDRSEVFGAYVFSLLMAEMPFDMGAIVTTPLDNPRYIDAHFHGFDDPVAVLESWGGVQGLNPWEQDITANPGRAFTQSTDEPRLATPSLRTLRAHLERFGIRHALGVALPQPDAELATAIIIVRRRDDAFDEPERLAMERLGPHLAEAMMINRVVGLGPVPAAAGRAAPARAWMNRSGQITQSTPAFARAFDSSGYDIAPMIRRDWLDRLRRAEPIGLKDGRQILEARPFEGGWLLRIRTARPADFLTRREREVVEHYADGHNHKEIAGTIGLSPATVRNHLQNAYRKLGVGNRIDLLRALRG